MINNALNSIGSGSLTSGLTKTSTPSSVGIKSFTIPNPPPAPTQAIKKQVHADAGGGTVTTHYDTPKNLTPQVAGSTSYTTQAQPTPQVNNTPKQEIPPQSTFQQSTGGLLNVGQGNNNNSTVNQANQGLLSIGQGESPEIQQARQRILNLEQSQAKSTAGIESTAEPIEQMQGQQGVQQRLYSGLLGAAQNNLTNALSEQSARSGALNSAGGLGTSQQGQNIGALGSAAGYSAPQQYGLTSQPYNPVENTYGGGGANGAIDRAVQAGNISTAQDYAQKYNEGNARIRAAENLDSQIASTLLANPDLNKTPISAITNLNQWLAGQTSDPKQQQLASQVASYISALGLSPDQAAAIATQQGGTIATLLKTLKDNVKAQNEAYNPKNLGGGGASLNQTSQSILDKYGIK